MAWNAESASKLLKNKSNVYFMLPDIKYTYRYELKNLGKVLHLAISKRIVDGSVSAYINLRSISGENFRERLIDGIEVAKLYPHGHIGKTGDKGIASSVARLETLNPKNNDVVLLHINSPSAFENLIEWYISNVKADLIKPIVNMDRQINIGNSSSSASTPSLVDESTFENEVSIIEAQQKELSKLMSPTEIDAWVKRRLGQGSFRSELLPTFDHQCALSEINVSNLLIASHIRPWSKCEPGEHRNPNNGLLLSVTWDALFDKGLIGFNEDGSMLISELLDGSTLEKLGISEKPSLPHKFLSSERCVFLQYHRDNVLKRAAENEPIYSPS